MAALASMKQPEDQLVPLSDQPDNIQQGLQQQTEWGSQDQQLVQRRRLMMQEEVMLAGGDGLHMVQQALNQTEDRAQQHRLEVFMRSTRCTPSDVEMRLQEQLDHALRATHDELLSNSSSTARDIRNHIASTDEKVEHAHSQPEVALENYQAQARAAHESVSVAQLNACQLQLCEGLDSTRRWLEESVNSQTHTKISEAQDTLQHQIMATRDDAVDSVCQLEARLQAKLDEAAANSVSICKGFIAKIHDVTQELMHLVGDKVDACETHLLNAVDSQVTNLEEKMQHNIKEALAAAEHRTASRFEAMEAKSSKTDPSMELRVQSNIQAQVESKLSTMELIFNNLLQSAGAHLSAETTNQIAFRMRESEARIIQLQQDQHHKAQIAHTVALSKVESRLMQIVTTSSDSDRSNVKAALEAIEKKLESRLAATLLPKRSSEHPAMMHKAMQDYELHAEIAKYQRVVRATDDVDAEIPATQSISANETEFSDNFTPPTCIPLVKVKLQSSRTNFIG